MSTCTSTAFSILALGFLRLDETLIERGWWWFFQKKVTCGRNGWDLERSECWCPRTGMGRESSGRLGKVTSFMESYVTEEGVLWSQHVKTIAVTELFSFFRATDSLASAVGFFNPRKSDRYIRDDIDFGHYFSMRIWGRKRRATSQMIDTCWRGHRAGENFSVEWDTVEFVYCAWLMWLTHRSSDSSISELSTGLRQLNFRICFREFHTCRDDGRKPGPEERYLQFF